MIVPANPLPVGCPPNWPIRFTAESGVQVVYDTPHSRQPPGLKRFRGIGIKTRKEHVTKYVNGAMAKQYPDDDRTWAGLYDQKLHELFSPFRIRDDDSRDKDVQQNGQEMLLHLPMMGMPPRDDFVGFRA